MVVGQFSQDVDILVVGGGPAGYTAAFRAAELGKTVAIVDPNAELGGECLHHTCIPSKSALHGIASDTSVETLSNGLKRKCKALGIERLHGLAHFENAKTAQITGEVVSIVKFRKAIIASGSKKREDSNFQNAIQVEEIYKNTIEGKKVLIVGNTPSAVEAATFLSKTNTVSLWCDDEFLPTFNTSLTKLLARTLFKVVTHCNEKPNAEVFNVCILASHRLPQSESLQLTKARVDSCDGFIETNTSFQTSNPKIFAVGECTGCKHSAAFAIAQGRIAAESACGQDSQLDSTCIPQVVWSSPELAQCGEFDPEHTTTIQWGNSGLATVLGQQKGITILSFEPGSQAILGVGILGDGATEMISEAVLAIEMGATLYDLATTIRPHPTRCEMLSEAARTALSSL